MDSNVNKSYNTSHSQSSSSDYCEGTWLPESYQDVKESIHNLKIRDDDVWVCSFPKTGTTWTKEMVWCIANDLDFAKAEENLLIRFSSLEGGVIFKPENNPIPLRTLQDLNQLPSPRFISSHLPYHLLPRQLTEGKTKAKIIYTLRNPKDTCISYYHFAQYMKGYSGTFENFCDHFLDDKIIYTPYWKNVIGFMERKDSNNILFLKYEDMKKDLRQAIQQTATFLNKNFTDDQVRILEDHLSFDKMKSNPAVNHEKMFEEYIVSKPWAKNQIFQKFMRKGEADQWKTKMSADLIKKFDDWTSSNLDKYPELKHKFS